MSIQRTELCLFQNWFYFQRERETDRQTDRERDDEDDYDDDDDDDDDIHPAFR